MRNFVNDLRLVLPSGVLMRHSAISRYIWQTTLLLSRCFTSTKTIRRENGGSLYTYRYTVTTRMTPALRWAAMRAIIGPCFINRDKVTRLCPRTTTFLKRKESQSGIEPSPFYRVQELCESRGGRPGLPVLMSLMVSVDVKQH